MFTLWAAYAVLVSAILTGGGLVLERATRRLRLPRRWIWSAILGVATLAPVVTLVDAGTVVVGFGAWEPAVEGNPSGPVAGEPGGEKTLPISSAVHSLGLWFEEVFPALWLLGSVCLVFALAVSAQQLRAMRRGWTRTRVGRRSVLVSDEVGPAVVGAFHPEIVLPAWVLDLPDDERALVLMHEQEHVRAGDPALAFFGLIPLLLLPWNPVLWWAFFRLRLAIEIDCDLRVVRRRGVSPRGYGRVLVRVGARSAAPHLGIAAVGGPVSILRRRILALADEASGSRRRSGYLLVFVGALLGATAYTIPHPEAPLHFSFVAVLTDRPVESSPEAIRTRPTPPWTGGFFETLDGLSGPDAVAMFQLRAEVRDIPGGVTMGLALEVAPSGRVVEVAVLDSSGMPEIDRIVARAARRIRVRPAGESEGGSVALRVTFASDGSVHLDFRPRRITLTGVVPTLPGAAGVPDDGGNRPLPPPPAGTEDDFVPRDTEPELLNARATQLRLQWFYPPVLRDSGVEGTVQVHFVIDEQGRVVEPNVQRTSGYQTMDEAALRAAEAMRFAPALLEGEPVAVPVVMSFEFRREN